MVSIELYKNEKIQETKQLWAEAVKATRIFKPADMKVAYLTDIVRCMSDVGETHEAEILLTRIIRLANKLQNDYLKGLSLISLPMN